MSTWNSANENNASFASPSQNAATYSSPDKDASMRGLFDVGVFDIALFDDELSSGGVARPVYTSPTKN